MVVRRSHNRVDSLNNGNGDLVLDRTALKALVDGFIQNLCQGDGSFNANTILHGCFPSICHWMLSDLQAFFSKEDVRRALFHMSGFKAPGLDVFQAVFY